MRRSVCLPLALFAAAAGCAAPAAAQDTPSSGIFKKAGDLYPLCTSKDEDDLEVCDWYLMGAFDMAVFFFDTGQTEASFCLPSGSQSITVRQAVVAYLAKDQGRMRYSAVSTVINALSAVHPAPCKK
ncbi:MAG: hypothetical protein EOP58_02790 [Sphingomonadales bacterium]|nr:MAG: hypothetical protein EOP58_02790 [Sphingomonadales bacterium]